ncbi:hypothetical protein Vadar_012133 [Vaccinium darrowii]|uniref:Uncharacterized protein n=1 Tax=Vaccinium darrowii TaxID=229202 RepID=A0ACB7YMD7_9ERIC|nr:hypothetical protein Vadar_012133 [Vaccinium darrowii]
MGRSLLQFLIIVFFFVSGTLSFGFSPKSQVRIISGVPNNPQPLLVHCQSEDDDIGTYVLPIGEEIDWHFKLNVFGTTLFHCRFHWDSKDKTIDVFHQPNIFRYYKTNNCTMSFGFPHKAQAQVHIISGVPNNPQPLLVHCESANDDIGTHALQTGEELDWQFKLDVFGRTLFHCHFNWDSKDKSIDVFHQPDIFHYYKTNNWAFDRVARRRGKWDRRRRRKWRRKNRGDICQGSWDLGVLWIAIYASVKIPIKMRKVVLDLEVIPTMGRILLQFLIIVAFFVSSTMSFGFPHKAQAQVRIISGVPNNPQPLLVHCESANDDIGTHVLQAGEELDWHFKLDVFGRTLFHCHFNWDSKDKSIDVFHQPDIFHYYKTNNWLVKPDGFYFSTSTNWEKKYGWN